MNDTTKEVHKVHSIFQISIFQNAQKCLVFPEMVTFYMYEGLKFTKEDVDQNVHELPYSVNY